MPGLQTFLIVSSYYSFSVFRTASFFRLSFPFPISLSWSSCNALQHGTVTVIPWPLILSHFRYQSSPALTGNHTAVQSLLPRKVFSTTSKKSNKQACEARWTTNWWIWRGRSAQQCVTTCNSGYICACAYCKTTHAH